MIVVILVGVVLNSFHLTFHLTSLCWFTGECLWVPKRKIKCWSHRSMKALLNVFPKVAEKSHICHRTVADQWLKTNWAQESSSRKEMLIWFMSVSQNILIIYYFDWFDHKKKRFFHPDLPLAMSLLMIPREFKQLLHCQFLWLKARIGNWDLKANFIPLVWSKLSNTSRRHAQCTL